MQTYALAPATIRRQLARVFWRFQLVVTVNFLAFGLYLLSLGHPVQAWTLAPVVLVVALAYFLIIFYHYRQQLRILYSIRVELHRDRIILRQVWQPPLMITRAEVLQVVGRPDGLLIQTDHARLSMIVPYGLANDGDFEVRRVLSNWTMVDIFPRKIRRVNWMMFWFSVLSGLIILMFANSLLVAVPMGVFLFFFGTYAEGRLIHTHDVEQRISRSYSLAYSFLIFLIIMKACFLWFLTLR